MGVRFTSMMSRHRQLDRLRPKVPTDKTARAVDGCGGRQANEGIEMWQTDLTEETATLPRQEHLPTKRDAEGDATFTLHSSRRTV